MSLDEGQLELIDLRRRVGDTVALDWQSFRVPRGQVSGFLRVETRAASLGAALAREAALGRSAV